MKTIFFYFFKYLLKKAMVLSQDKSAASLSKRGVVLL
jgi:hypothetical protein